MDLSQLYYVEKVDWFRPLNKYFYLGLKIKGYLEEIFTFGIISVRI